MSVPRRRTLVFAFALVLLAAGAFWVASLSANLTRATLPVEEQLTSCGAHEEGWVDPKEVTISSLGTFQTMSMGGSPIVAQAGKAYISKSGLKTVPLRIASINGKAFAEGIGETNFWFDGARPVESHVWERKPGTEFPAIQQMRFHFYYTAEALPGKLYRSMNPAIMRSDFVKSWPPPPGTVYRLMNPVSLEDIDQPGVVAGVVVSNRIAMGPKGDKPQLPTRRR